MSWLARHKFLLLLLTLLILAVVYPILHETFAERLIWDLVITILFLASFLVLFTERRLRIPGLFLGLPTLVGAWIGYAIPGVRVPLAAAAFHLLAASYLGFTVAAVLRHIYLQERVRAESIYGAFCGYVLVGLSFGHIYGAIELYAPGSFKLDAQTSVLHPDDVRRHFHLSYFSIVTLTTLGYGDITPLRHGTRGLAVAEAIIGQFYIAVLIGDLIGKRVATVLAERDAFRKRDIENTGTN